jgi:tetratricopeptide (TPR) repeat protein
LADAFLYLVLFAVALWTARLAMSKGRNPWAWGGAALCLSLIPWHLLGVVPVLLLLFMKSPATSPSVRDDRMACPRCAKSHSGGQHFCTGCGWDLSVAYSPEEPDGVQPSPTQPQTQATMPSTAVAEPPEAAEVPAPPVSTTPAPVLENEVTELGDSGPATDMEPAVEGAQDSVEEAEVPADAAADAAVEEPAADYVPWGTYDPGVAPTAAVMTERGIERFDAGKYQEAIDQFTKAIALDPDYADAWQRRSEAYAQLGRSEQAAEDRRHLQGLDPSSSPG